MKICVDPGHGGGDSGSVGASGTKEKDINLAIALKVGSLLIQNGHDVLFTREVDEEVDLHARAPKANAFGAELFLSIHCDDGGDASVTGIDCLTSRSRTTSDIWAKHILTALLTAFPDHKDHAGDGPSENKHLVVLRDTTMPAVLVECEFLSNPDMEEFLKQNADKIGEVIANAVHQGIGDYPA